ncbi:hypothetical protein DOTSEDRAFT_75682 [Dothistroma septosporum NZE10]|uniref:Uncharacterized protein n=1 Tax=Dothistroma septosporum (strain NZE10 / CBS 128990) TaxID=675120 RepID=M2YJG5_DOTSN|nr:hypothetical protein DOTSEDRAFT_75682 [Dothistroma septosporum NZE10]
MLKEEQKSWSDRKDQGRPDGSHLADSGSDQTTCSCISAANSNLDPDRHYCIGTALSLRAINNRRQNQHDESINKTEFHSKCSNDRHRAGIVSSA